MPRPFEIRKIEEFTAPIWEAQIDAGETKEMYSMFLCYRNIRPAERTVMGAWRIWTKDTQSEGKAISSYFSGVAQAFLWSERAATYDIARLQDRYKVWGQRDWMLRDEVWDAGEKIHKKAMTALDKIKDENLNLSLAEIASLLSTATALREKAIPSIGTLNTNQIREVLAAMPENKREAVLRIVVAEWKQIAPNEPKPQLPAPVRTIGAKLPPEDEIIDILPSRFSDNGTLAPRVIIRKVYPEYIEKRLLQEASHRVSGLVARRKLRAGLTTWHDYVSEAEAEEIARKARRPKGYAYPEKSHHTIPNMIDNVDYEVPEVDEDAIHDAIEDEMNYSAELIEEAHGTP